MSDLIKTIDNVQKIIGKSITNVSGDIYNIEDIGNFIIKKENKTFEKNLTTETFEVVFFIPCEKSGNNQFTNKSDVSVINNSELYGRDGKPLSKDKLLAELEYIYNIYNNPGKCL